MFKHILIPVDGSETSMKAVAKAAALAKTALKTEAAEPVLTPRQAHEKQRYVVPPMHLTRSAWARTKPASARRSKAHRTA